MLRIAIVILTLCLSGCAGYRLGNIQGQEMRDVKTIFVPVAKNQSYEPVSYTHLTLPTKA